MRRYRVPLHCHHCERSVAHSVDYLGNVIASISCTHCLATLRTPPELLRRQYLRDLELRVARKPAKMLHHAKKHPVDFLFHYMPKGLWHKPGEVLREWAELSRGGTDLAA
jgi:hypothetical protein